MFEVNGQKIKNLKELVGLVESCKEEYLKFSLEYNCVVYINAMDALSATKAILASHCIPHDRSIDLREPQANGVGN